MDINQVKTQVKTQVTTFDEILVFCSIPHSKAEIADYCGYKNNKNFTKKYLRPLLDSGTLKMTIPNKPNSRNQKYITVRTEWNKKQDIGFHPYRPASYLFLNYISSSSKGIESHPFIGIKIAFERFYCLFLQFFCKIFN